MIERGFGIRIIKYWRKHGYLKTIRRFFSVIYQNIIQNKYVIYYFDLKLFKFINRNTADITVENKIRREDISDEEKKVLISFKGETQYQDVTKRFFKKNAKLWLVRCKGELAGFCWSIEAGTIRYYFFPLTDKDVHIFNVEILEPFRGRGLNPILMNHVCNHFLSEGYERAFIETATWNLSEIRSLSKLPCEQLGIARKFTLLQRTITIWDNSLKI
jgi:ribosomal protein S18 acetylase RimI-like enzyme